MAEQWVTHKFGGSSLADASGYRAAASNLEESTGVRAGGGGVSNGRG